MTVDIVVLVSCGRHPVSGRPRPDAPRNSLCLIVRNEEDYLEGCLASAAELCD